MDRPTRSNKPALRAGARSPAWLPSALMLALCGCAVLGGTTEGLRPSRKVPGAAADAARALMPLGPLEVRPWCEAPSRPVAGWQASASAATMKWVLATHLDRERVPHSRRVARTIAEQTRRHDLDPLLILAMMKVESGFRPEATSRAGAIGLLQVRPVTGRAVAHEVGLRWDGPATLLDPETNVRVGIAYLAEMLDRFDDLEHALAAYNRGPHAVGRALTGGRSVPRQYVHRVWRTYQDLREELGKRPEWAWPERTGTFLGIASSSEVRA